MTKREKMEGAKYLNSHSTKADNSLTSKSKPNLVSTKIRKIGNSRGILLNSAMIRELGIADDGEVEVTTENGQIIIKPAKFKRKINTDLSTWEAQFKAAIKNGDKPENDLFEGMENEFDKEEW